jgi:RNA recognition motif-containing protein
VEQFFTDNGFKVAQISMSTDPFTGRNPSYCFVDLETADEATKAMAELNGKEVLGRPVKINPGMKKSFAAGSTPKREWGSRDGTSSRTTCKSLF